MCHILYQLQREMYTIVRYKKYYVILVTLHDSYAEFSKEKKNTL